MTTPEPRVRVEYVDERSGYGWECGGCDESMLFYDTRAYAIDAATDHAATCPALRLAALVRELEALRDGWTSRALYVDGSLLPPVSVERRIYQRAADDLTALLARAAGGTGC